MAAALLVCALPCWALEPTVEISVNFVRVKWASVGGRTYDVEKSDDLKTWQLLAEGVSGNGATNTAIDFTTNRARFYRVTERPF